MMESDEEMPQGEGAATEELSLESFLEQCRDRLEAGGSTLMESLKHYVEVNEGPLALEWLLEELRGVDASLSREEREAARELVLGYGLSPLYTAFIESLEVDASGRRQASVFTARHVDGAQLRTCLGFYLELADGVTDWDELASTLRTVEVEKLPRTLVIWDWDRFRDKHPEDAEACLEVLSVLEGRVELRLVDADGVPMRRGGPAGAA